MPYIKKEDREKFDETIEVILDCLKHDFVKGTGYDKNKDISVGELNYIISSIIWRLFDEKPSYTLGNGLVGVLECVKQEFIRRRLNGYEDQKIKENGDL